MEQLNHHLVMAGREKAWRDASLTLAIVDAQSVKCDPPQGARDYDAAKKVLGRKTDVKDVEWIAQPVCHNPVASSFVPPPAIRDLRELVRHRRTLIETRTAVRNWVL